MYNKLSDKKIFYGERWIYSAGFNISVKPNNKERLIEEIDDLNKLLSAGASVSILSHQGSYDDNTAVELDYLIPYLNNYLNTKIKYYPENNTNSAIHFSKNIKPGEAVIFGNTRFHKGEQINDLKLAKKFSLLGNYVAIGGFSKAHRSNASNVGITNFIPAYLSEGITKQLKLLDRWTNKNNDSISIAVLGGDKVEKLTIGLTNLIDDYEYVIPGGVVLNTILKILGKNISSSITYENDLDNIKTVEKILGDKSLFRKILLPKSIFIKKRYCNEIKEVGFQKINMIEDNNFTIVDFSLNSKAISFLENTVINKGKLLMSGSPSFCKEGHYKATNQIIQYFNQNYENSILLGGDTVEEIKSKAHKSSGGGAALEYICKNNLVILDALRANTKKFNIG